MIYRITHRYPKGEPTVFLVEQSVWDASRRGGLRWTNGWRRRRLVTMATWADVEYATFTLNRGEDGIDRVTVDRFPDVLAVSGELLRSAHEGGSFYLRHDHANSLLEINVTNGRAVYGVGEYDEPRDAYLCELVQRG